MMFCASTFSNKCLIEETTKCLLCTSLKSTHSIRISGCASLLVSTDKYHSLVCHNLRGDKSASNKYDQYVVYLTILNHDVLLLCSILTCVTLQFTVFDIITVK